MKPEHISDRPGLRLTTLPMRILPSTSLPNGRSRGLSAHFLAAVLCLSLCAADARASHFHGSVNGHLVTPEAEAGTVSAKVRLFKLGDAEAAPREVASRLANPDGTFQFCGLAVPGKYRLRFDMAGYDRVDSEFTLSLATPRRPRLEILPQSRREAREKAGADSLASYAELLESFSEPGLCSGGGDAKASYRFVWIRDEDPPLVLEVRFAKDGSITAERQTLDLSSGAVESSGKIDLVSLHETRGGGSFVASRVGSTAEESFWDEPFRRVLPDEADLAMGSFWVVEGVRGKRCHVAERWSPGEDEPVRAFAEILMLEIAETRLFVDELY